MSRFRESAMVEPEPDYYEREKGGALMPFLFGLIIGFAGLAVWLGAPQVFDQLQAMYDERIAGLDEDWQTYAPIVVIGVVILFLLLVRRILLRIPLIIGLALGALVWVPFGNHIMAAVPAVEENLPALRGGIETFMTDYPALQSVRTMAEETIAVPGTEPAE